LPLKSYLYLFCIQHSLNAVRHNSIVGIFDAVIYTIKIVAFEYSVGSGLETSSLI